MVNMHHNSSGVDADLHVPVKTNKKLGSVGEIAVAICEVC